MASENVLLFKQTGKNKWEAKPVPRVGLEKINKSDSRTLKLQKNSVSVLRGLGFEQLKPGETAEFGGKKFTGDSDRSIRTEQPKVNPVTTEQK